MAKQIKQLKQLILAAAAAFSPVFPLQAFSAPADPALTAAAAPRLAAPSLISPRESRSRLISMTVITEEDIKRCPGCDLPDILERAGVQVRRYHWDSPESSDTDAAFPALRGATDAQTDLFVDGIRQEDAMLAEPVYGFIPVHHIKRIEIIKGPSIMHGSPIGGLIHIFTKKADCPPEKLVCFEALSEISNESNTGKTGMVSGHVRSESGLSGVRISAQGDHSADAAEKSGSHREKFLALNASHMPEGRNWLLEGSASFYDSGSSGVPKLSEPGGGFDLISLGSSYYVSPNLLFQLITGYDSESQTYSDNRDEFEEKYTSRRISIKALGQYTFDFHGDSYELTAGLESQRESISSHPGINEDGSPEYPLRKRISRAAFSQMEGGYGPLAYQVSARADDLSGDIYEGIWTWSGAASWQVAKISSNDIFIRTGAGTGFRAPGFDEQYLWFDPDLELEKSKTYEFGLRIEKGSLYFIDVAVYETDLENTVSYGEAVQPMDGGKISGLGFQAGLNLGRWSSRANYTYTDAQNMRFARGHNPVRHLASAGADYSVTPKLALGADFTHRGVREVKLGDSVNLVDVRSSYNAAKGVRLGISVRNLMDEKYDLGFNTLGPSRTVWLTFEFSNF